MEHNRPESASRLLLMFAWKTAIVLVLVGVFLEFMLPDFSEIVPDVKAVLNKNFKNERAKLFSLSLVQNPAALYRVSEIDEHDGRVHSAVRDMELAIGLLEMHNADKQVIRRYRDRLEKLRAKEKSRP